MTVEEGFYSHLAAAAGVAALVSTRIYPLRAPQDANMPALVYQRISGPRDHTHSGASGLAQARMQVSCLATTYSGAKALAAAVRAAADGVSGTWGSTVVDSSMLVNELDDWADGFDAPVIRLDFMVWYQE